MENRTSIQIERSTLDKLKKHKIILELSPRATYDEVINKAMKLSGGNDFGEVRKGEGITTIKTRREKK